MKASELVLMIKTHIEKYGDLPIEVFADGQVDGDNQPVAGISTLCKDDEGRTPISFLVCDIDTLDAFYEDES